MMTEKMEKQFNIASQASLSVSNIRGSVVLRVGEQGIIQVTASRRSGSGDEERTGIEITQNTDGMVRVVTRYPEIAWNWLGGLHPCDVDYVITAPRTCSFTLNGVSSSVHAEGFEGDFTVNSVSGEIVLRGITGSLKIKTVSGDAEAETIKGSLILDTVSADVEIKESNLSSIAANSVSGDLRICTPLTQGPYTFNSVSGDVRLIFPPESRFTGELRSMSGDIRSAFPFTSGDRKFGSQTVRIKDGGVIITMHSVSGDLSFDSDGDISSHQPSETISTDERRSILERLDRGEMTVSEALEHLQV
jgi:DUF4097 and DUF4098 domain-containing protein YvlB